MSLKSNVLFTNKSISALPGFQDNREIEEAIVWGVRNASNVVRYYGAKTGLLRRYQMLELLAAQKK